MSHETWLGHLRALHGSGAFLGVLSNMPPARDRLWRRTIPADSLFDGLVPSLQVGARKPDRRIFDVAAEMAGAAPEECLLVD